MFAYFIDPIPVVSFIMMDQISHNYLGSCNQPKSEQQEQQPKTIIIAEQNVWIQPICFFQGKDYALPSAAATSLNCQGLNRRLLCTHFLNSGPTHAAYLIAFTHTVFLYSCYRSQSYAMLFM